MISPARHSAVSWNCRRILAAGSMLSKTASQCGRLEGSDQDGDGGHGGESEYGVAGMALVE